MRDFGVVHTRFWEWAQEMELSDQGKLIAVYLLTCRHSNSLGCFRLPKEYVSADLGYSIDRVSKGYAELINKDFLAYCETTKYIFIPKYLKWNPPQNPKHAKGILKLIKQLPESFTLIGKMRESCDLYLAPYLDDESVDTLYYTLSHSLSHSVPIPTGNTDTDTDTERERESDTSASASSSPIQNNGIPLKRIFQTWNDYKQANNANVPALKDIKQGTQRYKHTRARWNSNPDIATWEQAIDKAMRSAFLNGNNQRGWTVDFDWIVKSEDNFTKVLEGKYDDGPKPENNNIPIT